MKTVLVIDNSPRDAERYSSLFEESEDLVVEFCTSGAEAVDFINNKGQCLVAIFILQEIPGPPFAFELLLHCRQTAPDLPVVVVSSSLDASLATRAFALGARDFLEKPLDLQRVKQCLQSLLVTEDSDLPIVNKLNQTVLGSSSALRATLSQVAKVIRHPETRVLLIGESGTGKELIAQAIHRLGPHSAAPCTAVNINAIPKELIESQLFGHEKGAFTGATEAHHGYLEEAESGTLFLDEIGDLDFSLQVKLLRVIQERSFRRLNGVRDLDFNARLITATNRDLAAAVQQGTFRRDLFHRIAEVIIHVPPLRERKDDIDNLLEHFLSKLQQGKKVRFARETLTILRSYPFPGNVRELENLVNSALIECNGEWILPQHLPLKSMAAFLRSERVSSSNSDVDSSSLNNDSDSSPEMLDSKLIKELKTVLPQNWFELPYKEAFEYYQQAFDRVYLPPLIERYRHNLTKATKAAGVDKKTFERHWKEAGLPPLRADEEKADG